MTRTTVPRNGIKQLDRSNQAEVLGFIDEIVDNGIRFTSPARKALRKRFGMTGVVAGAWIRLWRQNKEKSDNNKQEN